MRYNDDYEYQNYNTIDDVDELYSYDNNSWDYDDTDYNDSTDTVEWENYYHNIADEIVDE